MTSPAREEAELSHTNEWVTEKPVRGIADELYHQTALAARNYKVPNTDIVILNPGGRLVWV